MGVFRIKGNLLDWRRDDLSSLQSGMRQAKSRFKQEAELDLPNLESYFSEPLPKATNLV